MCFSLEADLLAGVVVTGTGVLAFRSADNRADRLFSALPLVLGAHLLVEVPVWVSLEHEVPAWIGAVSAWVYLAIALVAVPVIAPLAVAAATPAARPRSSLFAVLGSLVAGMLLIGLVDGPVDAAIDGSHIDYDVPVIGGGWTVAAYVVATCGGAIASCDRSIKAFGVLNLIAVGALVLVEQGALISLWCAWAAVTSAMVWRRVRNSDPVEKDLSATRRHGAHSRQS